MVDAEDALLVMALHYHDQGRENIGHHGLTLKPRLPGPGVGVGGGLVR